MSALLQLDRSAMAARSLRTVMEIAEHVESVGGWRSSLPVTHEAAREAKSLFDLLAWSDGSLDAEEEKLIGRLSEVVPQFGDALISLPTFAPANPLHAQVPPLLESLVAFDKRTGDRLATIYIDCLETFGYTITAAQGRPSDIGQSELGIYIESLRNWVAMLMNA